MRFEPDPLDPVGTGLKTGDVNPEVRDMILLSTRLRVRNPDVVVPPSELRCHGRRLMVQSLSSSHAFLHRSHSPIAIIGPVESAELELDCNLQSISASIEAVCRKTLQDVNRDSEQNLRPKISVKNYMSDQQCWGRSKTLQAAFCHFE
jgi:hypothetical protein